MHFLLRSKRRWSKRDPSFHIRTINQLTHGRTEDPEQFAARIKQAASACKFTANGGTSDYGADLISTIFILGLEDVYTREQLFQLKQDGELTTVSFDKLVSAASEIATAKENCAEASNTTVCGISDDKKHVSDLWIFQHCCSQFQQIY